MAELARLGVTALQLDAASLEQTEYLLEDDRLVVADGGREVVLEGHRRPRGWVRRLAPPDWRRQDPPATHEGAVRASWVALLVAIARGLGVDWLSDLERLFVAENKLVQQAAARELGIAVPRSVVTSTRERIPRDFGDSLIVKPLGPGQFVRAEGVAQVLYARELARDAHELDALAGAPFLIQERLVAERHLRIVTVGSCAWVCRLDASELPVDWRRIDEAHDAFVISEEHADVAAQALRIAARLNVGYTSQDWLIADRRPYFLDLNPAGQWLFLPEAVASAVTSGIAAWLAGEDAADASGAG